jgi:hypothetical protein
VLQDASLQGLEGNRTGVVGGFGSADTTSLLGQPVIFSICSYKTQLSLRAFYFSAFSRSTNYRGTFKRGNSTFMLNYMQMQDDLACTYLKKEENTASMLDVVAFRYAPNTYVTF